MKTSISLSFQKKKKISFPPSWFSFLSTKTFFYMHNIYTKFVLYHTIYKFLFPHSLHILHGVCHIYILKRVIMFTLPNSITLDGLYIVLDFNHLILKSLQSIPTYTLSCGITVLLIFDKLCWYVFENLQFRKCEGKCDL